MSSLVEVDAGAVINGLFKGIDGLFTSDEERAQAKLLMQIELQKPHMMQALTTLEEAKHPNWFIAGWRPALGWLTVVLLAYAWIGRDFIIIGLSLAEKASTIPMLPVVDTGQLLTLVMALLGLGGLRTYEKMNGKARG